MSFVDSLLYFFIGCNGNVGQIQRILKINCKKIQKFCKHILLKLQDDQMKNVLTLILQ